MKSQQDFPTHSFVNCLLTVINSDGFNVFTDIGLPNCPKSCSFCVGLLLFKTFTIALALEYDLVDTKTVIKNIPKSVKCSKYEISDIKEFPKNLTVEDILIRSSNIGTLLLGRKIGIEKYKKFIDDSNLLKTSKVQLTEVGTPHNLKWNKCKLETVSYGHGITTTPLPATTVYASLTNGGVIIKPNLLKGESQTNLGRLRR